MHTIIIFQMKCSSCDQAKNKCFLKITSEISFKNCYIKSINELKWSFLLSLFRLRFHCNKNKIFM